MKILFYIIPFLLTCCSSPNALKYEDFPEAFYGEQIESIYYNDSTKSIIEYVKDYHDSKYFFLSKITYPNYNENTCQNTDSLSFYLIRIVDKEKKTFEVLDTIDLEIKYTNLYITEDYYFFPLLITRSIEIHKPSDSLLVSGLLLFNKEDDYKLFKYYQNKIILLEQKDDLFHVVTAGMSFEWDFLGEPFYSIFGTSKLTIASLYSNGKFTEYYYNQDLELVHSKAISEQRAIKLYKQSLKKRNKNIRQKE
jgi:hypothetical protein